MIGKGLSFQKKKKKQNNKRFFQFLRLHHFFKIQATITGEPQVQSLST